MFLAPQTVSSHAAVNAVPGHCAGALSHPGLSLHAQVDLHILKQQPAVQHLWADDPDPWRPHAFHLWAGTLQQQWGTQLLYHPGRTQSHAGTRVLLLFICTPILTLIAF